MDVDRLPTEAEPASDEAEDAELADQTGAAAHSNRPSAQRKTAPKDGKSVAAFVGMAVGLFRVQTSIDATGCVCCRVRKSFLIQALCTWRA